MNLVDFSRVSSLSFYSLFLSYIVVSCGCHLLIKNWKVAMMKMILLL